MKKMSNISAFLFSGTRFCSNGGSLASSALRQVGFDVAPDAAPVRRAGEWMHECLPLSAGS